MAYSVDYRQKKIQEWMQLEQQYSEIGAAIRPHLAKLEDDSLTDAQWDQVVRAIERLYDSLKHVSESKQNIARVIADL
jgi:Na+/phosphate symporter